MSRNGYTREQRRRYREGRQAKAKEIADRLLGKRKYLWEDERAPFFSGLNVANPFLYTIGQNLMVNSPRHNVIITGIKGA